MTSGLEDVLLDGLRSPEHISINAFGRAIAQAAVRHGGQLPSHVLASPSQVDAWVNEMAAFLTHRLTGGRRATSIMGVTVLPVAGPLRLIWSETVETAKVP